MTRMLRVQATRTFNAHTRGDVLLVAESKEIKKLVKSGLFDVIAIEEPAKAKPAKSTKRTKSTKSAKSIPAEVVPEVVPEKDEVPADV